MLDATAFDKLRIGLATADDIRRWSFGEVKKPETINYRTLKPEKDGLFGEQIFGPSRDWECSCGKYKRVRFKGIVCERCGVEVTKSSVRRERMGHIELAAPVTHIWYFKGVPSRLGYLLDMAPKDLEKVIYFAAYMVIDVDEEGRHADMPGLENELRLELKTLGDQRDSRIADRMQRLENDLAALEAEGAKADQKRRAKDVAEKEMSQIRKSIDEEIARLERVWDDFRNLKVGDLKPEDAVFNELVDRYGLYFDAFMGAEAIKKRLETFDLAGEAESLRLEITEGKGAKKIRAIKRLKVVSSFLNTGTSPAAMVLDVVPVIPPELRPMVQLDGGRFATSDLNDLYRRVINRNNRLRRLLDLGAPEIIVNNEKRMLQEAVDALFDNGRRGRPVTGTGNRALKSLSDMLKGKQGRFRQNLLGKRVDYSGRSVIIVGPQLKLHQCGLPKQMALELFKPFVIKRLIDLSHAQNIKSAKRMVERSRPQVWDVLEEIIRERPVLLNRAPTLHRLGIQAFEPQLIEGKAIQLHPLVCAAFNADFDGDQMAVHLPLSVEAQAEARILMLASNNILKPSDGRPVAVPTQDMIIGLFHMTAVKEGATGEGKAFGSIAEAQMAFDGGALDLQAKVRIRLERNGETKLVETTFGLALFNQALPEAYEYVTYQVGKKEIGKIVTELVQKFSRVEVAQALDRIKDAGFYWATRSGVSMSISDANFDMSGAFDKARSKMIVDGEKEHTKIQEAFDNGLKSDLERRDELGALWFKRTNEIQNLLQESIPADNAIFKMVTSGARGNWLQIRSIIGMRGPVATSSGDFAPMPVKGNYLVGLTANEYFINATGARKGNADTAMKTAAAGYLTRRLVDVAQDVIVREPDCGTNKGLEKSLKDIDGNWDEQTIELSVLHRALQNDVVVGKNVIAKAGSTVDAKVIEAFKAADVEAVGVRSVLTCESLQGVCALCYGISLATGDAVELGEAIGIIAAQSIGEPGTQLTMRTFHTGGAASSAKKQTILKSIGGQKVRVERLISYDITQGLNGVTDLLEARVGWRQQGKVAVMAFWPGTVDIVEVPTSGGAKKFDIYVRPNGEAAEKAAEDLANQYSFSRTTSKTFKKLSPYAPITSVSNPDDLLVEKGEEVKAGDYLVDGTPIPHEVLMVKGAREAAAEIIRGVQAIYGSQGVPLHDKHLEVIVRQMLGKVTVIDSGDTDMLPGEIIDRNRFTAINRAAVADGKKPASARQEVMGMTRASLAAQSWLSAASFQETTRVLTQAALDRREDPLVGLKENVIIGKLIPAGTGLPIYRNITVEATEEAKAEKYPNRIWAAPTESSDFSDEFSATDLSFTSIESYSEEK